ncbi:hypothetical protein F01_480205 [Burkholderia cenocepacia]|nr:hypothetical protein F01_480205 [Burkholderia cenocepacia]
MSGSSSAVVGKAVFEWNGSPFGQRDVRHDGGGLKKLPRGRAALARIAGGLSAATERVCRTVRRTIARPNSRG